MRGKSLVGRVGSLLADRNRIVHWSRSTSKRQFCQAQLTALPAANCLSLLANAWLLMPCPITNTLESIICPSSAHFSSSSSSSASSSPGRALVLRFHLWSNPHTPSPTPSSTQTLAPSHCSLSRRSLATPKSLSAGPAQCQIYTTTQSTRSLDFHPISVASLANSLAPGCR